MKTAAQASQRGDSDCSSSSGRTANSSSSEGDGAPESSGRSWWSLGRKEDTAAEEDNPPSQAGCSNVLPLYNIPESSSVQVRSSPSRLHSLALRCSSSPMLCLPLVSTRQPARFPPLLYYLLSTYALVPHPLPLWSLSLLLPPLHFSTISTSPLSELPFLHRHLPSSAPCLFSLASTPFPPSFDPPVCSSCSPPTPARPLPHLLSHPLCVPSAPRPSLPSILSRCTIWAPPCPSIIFSLPDPRSTTSMLKPSKHGDAGSSCRGVACFDAERKAEVMGRTPEAPAAVYCPCLCVQ